LLESIKLRKAVESDLPYLLELYREIEDDNKLNTDLYSARKQFEKIQSYPNYSIYVAEKDKIIIGSFELLIMDNLAHLGQPSSIVEDVVVMKKYQGLGIGKQMMQFAIQVSKKEGCYKLALSSNIKREKAHKFYEGLGFEKHGFSFKVTL
jgi:GNAT superfamily N-acetyltransferase